MRVGERRNVFLEFVSGLRKNERLKNVFYTPV